MCSFNTQHAPRRVSLTCLFLQCTVLKVYTPTNEATEKKDAFYFELQGMIYETPKLDILIVMGDLNAKVGGSREEIEEVVGPFTAAEETNENGETLVDLCFSNNLFLSKTLFKHKALENVQEHLDLSQEGRNKN